MAATWDPATNELHLHNGGISLVLRVLESGHLGQLHIGAPLAPGRDYRHLGRGAFPGFDNRVADPTRALPTWGSGDFRVPALASRMRTAAPSSTSPTPAIASSPASPPSTRCPRPTPRTTRRRRPWRSLLVDRASGVEVALALTIWRDLPGHHPQHGRSATPAGPRPSPPRCPPRSTCPTPTGMIQLSGAWARERHVIERPLVPGSQSIGSGRGASTRAPEPVPRAAPPAHHGGDRRGARPEPGPLRQLPGGGGGRPLATTRARIGIHPDGFAWTARAGRLLHDAGGGHRLDRGRPRRPVGRVPPPVPHPPRPRTVARLGPRPVLLNNWEGTYFDFDEDAHRRHRGGAPGPWRGAVRARRRLVRRPRRRPRPLGDWFVDRRKLPDRPARPGQAGDRPGHRLRHLDRARDGQRGQRPVPGASRVGRSACPAGRGRRRRQQLVLDMSQPEVVDHLATTLIDVLRDAHRYIKWDFNRYLTEPYGLALPPERQGEFHHRFVLGLYELYRRLMERSRTSCSSRCAAAAAASTRRCSPSRRRPGRATTRTRSSG